MLYCYQNQTNTFMFHLQFVWPPTSFRGGYIQSYTSMSTSMGGGDIFNHTHPCLTLNWSSCLCIISSFFMQSRFLYNKQFKCTQHFLYILFIHKNIHVDTRPIGTILLFSITAIQCKQHTQSWHYIIILPLFPEPLTIRP